MGLMGSIVVVLTGCGLLSTTPTLFPQNYDAVVSAPSLWTQLSPTGTAPAPRKEQASAYDATNDRLIIFGGTSTTQNYNDTWILTNASGNTGTESWVPLSTSGVTPSQRYSMVAGYNAINNILVVFGGVDNNNKIQMDLWLLTNANGLQIIVPTWSKLTMDGTPPSARYRMAGVYDETNDCLIFFGGGSYSSSTATLYDETWVIRNVTTSPSWSRLNPDGTLPPAIIDASAVYDAAGNRMIIFGGNTSTAYSPDPSGRTNDTWILSGANGIGGTPTWNQLNTLNKPPARSDHTAIFDGASQRMVVFAGTGSNNYVRSDVWVLTDLGETTCTWIEYDTGKPYPTSREYHSAVYAGGDKDSMVIFGGCTGGENLVNDVWVLKCANGIPVTPVSKIVIRGASTNLFRSYTMQLSAVATDASDNEIGGVLYTWSSSGAGVATVNSTGLVTGAGPGTATITVTGGGISGQYTITVIATSTTTPKSTSTIISTSTATPTFTTTTASKTTLIPSSIIPLTIDTRWQPSDAYIVVETDGTIHYQVTPQTLMAYGGSPLARYTWGKATGGRSFPPGITVDSFSGVLKGTGMALQEGTYTFDVEVSDGSRTVTAAFTITVEKYVKQSGPIPDPGPPTIILQQAQGMSTIPLVDGKAGQSYAASLYVAGGAPPYKWSVDPTSQSNFAFSGLTIDMSGGIVRGTISPSMSGQTITFSVIVGDNTGATAIPGPIYTIKVK